MGYVSFRESILLKGEKTRCFFHPILLDWRTFLCVRIVLLKDYMQVNSFDDFMDCHPSGGIFDIGPRNVSPKKKTAQHRRQISFGGQKKPQFFAIAWIADSQVATLKMSGSPKAEVPFFFSFCTTNQTMKK